MCCLAYKRCIKAEANLKTYGKVLMSEAPVEATALLKLLCTDYKPTPGSFYLLRWL